MEKFPKENRTVSYKSYPSYYLSYAVKSLELDVFSVVYLKINCIVSLKIRVFCLLTNGLDHNIPTLCNY